MRGADGLTGTHNLFEDFALGQVYRHGRGRTVDNNDNLRWTLATLNTAQAHFDLPYAQQLLDGAFPERLVMGGATLALVVGLTSQDMAENAVRELGYDDIRLRAPVFCGDTLRAESEVVELTTEGAPEGCGVLGYRFRGVKDGGATDGGATDGGATEVASGLRRVLVRRRTGLGGTV